MRHCRWVDEVVPDAPWKIDEAFLSAMRIDFVAIDEGVSIDPAYEKERVKGYDLVKSLRTSLCLLLVIFASEWLLINRHGVLQQVNQYQQDAPLD